MIKELIKDIAQYLPTAIIPTIIGFISVRVLTHLFSPEDYGNYMLVITTVNIFSILNAWLSISVIRFLPQEIQKGSVKEFTAGVLQMTMVSIGAISLLFAAMLFVIRRWSDPELFTMMHIGVAMFAVGGITEILKNFLQARRRVIQYSGFFVWQVVATFVLGLILVLRFNSGIRGMLYGGLLSGILAIPFLWSVSIGSVSMWPIHISRGMLWEMVKYSFPLVIANLSAWILNLSSRFFLNWLSGTKDVGIYSASYNISHRTIMLFVSVFMLAFGPLIVHTWEKEGKEATQRNLTKITRLYLLLCTPAVVGLSILAKPFVVMMTQEEYLIGYRIIPFITCGAFLIGLQQLYQTPFLLYRHTVPVTVYFVLAALCNMLLNVIVIPRYGLLGAGINTMLCYVLYFVLVASHSRKLLGWSFPSASLARILVASTIMALPTYYVGNTLSIPVAMKLTLAVLSGSLVYFAVLLVLGEITGTEIRKFLNFRQAS